MWEILSWLVVLLVIGGGVIAASILFKQYAGGTETAAQLKRKLFRPRSERRLEIVTHTSVDNRRRLVLVRRDGVEHLLMTGGPIDVVIETGIAKATESEVERSTLTSRPVTATLHRHADAAKPAGIVAETKKEDAPNTEDNQDAQTAGSIQRLAKTAGAA